MITGVCLSSWRIALLAGLAVAGLSACGGGSSDDSAPTETETAAVCADYPALPAVQGYPVYTVPDADLQDESRARQLMCDVGRHYDAGYAVVASQDVDPWNDPDKGATLEVADEVVSKDVSRDASVQVEYQVPVTEPVFSVQGNQREAFVLAARPGGIGEPLECSLFGADAAAVQRGIEACLTDLRNPVVEGNDTDVRKRALRAAVSDSVSRGGATVDPKVWTSLGRMTKTFDKDRQILWFDPERVGRGLVAFEVYRLNSAEDSFDYYLVRGDWSLTPEPRSAYRGCGRIDGCGFYNNRHKIRFGLYRKHGSGEWQPGAVEKHEPENVVRTQTYQTKLGAGLKVAEKGPEGSLSAEISTSYTYSAASIRSRRLDETVVEFEISHATDIGIYTLGGDLYKGDSTTISNMNTSVWVVYKFPVSERDKSADASLVLDVGDFSGSFGNATPAALLWGPVETHLYDYRVVDSTKARAFTASYALPHFSVRMRNERGQFVEPTTDAEAPLTLKRGQTVTFQIDAGGSAGTVGTHPISLGWQLIDLPKHFIASNQSGRQKSTVQITVDSSARVDPLSISYLHFDTAPRAAAPGLQAGSISIPVRIVE